MLAELAAAAITLATAGDGVEYRQPQIAVLGKSVAVTFGAGKAIFLVHSKDGGRTFGAPRKVTDTPSLALGRHRGPRIALTPTGIVVSAVVGEKGGGADGDILAWRSADGGATWQGPSRVNDVAAAAREGLHSMASDERGTLYAAWLDLRAKGTRLYGSESRDGGATWSKNHLVYESPDGHICECCHPSIVAGSGRVEVMFRNWLGGNRDLYLVPFSGGTPRRLGSESWQLNACPMDGGGAAFTADGKLVSVFRRMTDIVFEGAPSVERVLATGKDPALALTPAGATVTWTAADGLMVWNESLGETTLLDPKGGFGQVAPGGGLVVWESQGSIFAKRTQ